MSLKVRRTWLRPSLPQLRVQGYCPLLVALVLEALLVLLLGALAF
jgi:hypothetical protein